MFNNSAGEKILNRSLSDTQLQNILISWDSRKYNDGRLLNCIPPKITRSVLILKEDVYHTQDYDIVRRSLVHSVKYKKQFDQVSLYETEKTNMMDMEDDWKDTVQDTLMDVDIKDEPVLSQLNHRRLNIVFNENINNKPNSFDKYNFENNKSTLTAVKIDNKNNYKGILIVALILLASLSVSFLAYFWSYIAVNDEIQTWNIEKDLNKYVFAQDHVKKNVIYAMETRNKWPDKLKVLAFVGTQGVGKTHIANIVKSNFLKQLYSDIFGINLNDETTKRTVLNSLNKCCLNLIVIDDLNIEHMQNLFKFLNSVPKDYFVLVITIFNLNEADDDLNIASTINNIHLIRKNFDESDLYHEVIVFKQFSRHEAEMWIRNQLNLLDIKNPQESYDDIIKNALELHDVNLKGLKGLYSKLLLEVQNL